MGIDYMLLMGSNKFTLTLKFSDEVFPDKLGFGSFAVNTALLQWSG